MAIERGVDEIDIDELGIEDNSKEIVIGEEASSDEIIDSMGEDDIQTLDDGTMVFGMEDEAIPNMMGDFNQNLAEIMDDQDLGKIFSDCMGDVQDDISSRKEWMDQYKEGLEFLGMKFEDRTEPFEGASGVIHPLLAESVTQFQAQAYKEMLPPGGPVKTQTVGLGTPQTDLQAARVQEYMNYMLTQEMKEYDPETDQLLFYLPLSGSAFRKVHFDQSLGRPVSRFIPSEKLIVPYGTSSLDSAVRITHVIDMPTNEVKKLQQSGFYKKTPMSGKGTGADGYDEVDEEIDELQGVKPSGSTDYEAELYEMHIELDIPGFEDVDAQGEETGIKLPYIVTLYPKDSSVLSIRRNYLQADPMRRRIDYFVHYKFLPGVGFYGFGLTHMIGGLSRASTSILRQLIDAGTLANLPAGFKARGMRIRDEDEPLQPGEFRDIDTTGGSLRENLIPLPIKEPSNVLMSLLGLLVESGKRFAAIADTNIGDMNQAMPVGTTVALLERGTKVMSAIHKRLHYAQRIEFQLLSKVFADYLPPEYAYETGTGPREIKQSDFDERIDVIPVSDPNIFSQSQRITLAQELLQMVQSNPQVHGPNGIYEAYRRMYGALGIDNVESLLQPPPDMTPKPIDAGLENSGFLMGQPAQAFEGQNHRAHVDAHRALFLTQVVKENPQLQSLIISHIMQHLQFLATELAQQQIPPEQMQQIQQAQQQLQQLPVDQQQQVSQQIQITMDQFAAPIMAQLTQELLQSIGQGSDSDPLVQIRQAELELRDKELDQEQTQFEAKQNQRAQEKLLENEIQKDRMNVQKEVADDKLDVALQRLDQQAEFKLMELGQKMQGN